ncbi:DHH family phosphoesterase, partial [Proteus mirabilis]|uniref:DHH family phosphoesterase n=1 Tax=Proteus mirabilis TaxID=584 RepID=UPI0027B942A3
MEKRTRVRARVIAHALREIVRESDQVFIMGHHDPDLDSIGSAIGVLKAVRANGKEGFIILDRQQETSGIDQLLQHIDREPALLQSFITPSAALEQQTQDSLLVIVDTHKPALVMEPKLLT